jgi:hypothetical protein
VPLALGAPLLADRTNNLLEVLGRLRPGVSFDHASSEAQIVNAQLVQKYPKELENTGISVLHLRDELSSKSRLLLLALCGAALCILLLACANLANLLLARAIAREREISVRSALGAGRERIVRQLATESVVLALLGGCAGLLVAKLAIPALTQLVPAGLPIAEQPTLDGRILLFAALRRQRHRHRIGLLPRCVPAARRPSPPAVWSREAEDEESTRARARPSRRSRGVDGATDLFRPARAHDVGGGWIRIPRDGVRSCSNRALNRSTP